MIQNGLKNKEKDIKGVQRQACSILDVAWTKGYVAGCTDGHSAEVEAFKRPKGEWVAFDLTFGRNFYYCTVCKETEDLPPTRWFKFCPNCGADMREV